MESIGTIKIMMITSMILLKTILIMIMMIKIPTTKTKIIIILMI